MTSPSVQCCVVNLASICGPLIQPKPLTFAAYHLDAFKACAHFIKQWDQAEERFGKRFSRLAHRQFGICEKARLQVRLFDLGGNPLAGVLIEPHIAGQAHLRFDDGYRESFT